MCLTTVLGKHRHRGFSLRWQRAQGRHYLVRLCIFHLVVSSQYSWTRWWCHQLVGRKVILLKQSLEISKGHKWKNRPLGRKGVISTEVAAQVCWLGQMYEFRQTRIVNRSSSIGNSCHIELASYSGEGVFVIWHHQRHSRHARVDESEVVSDCHRGTKNEHREKHRPLGRRRLLMAKPLRELE